MIKLIKTDMNIMFHKKGFQVSFLIILIYALWVTISYVIKQRGMDVSEMYHPVKLSGLNADSQYIWFFCKWFPFLVVLPAGFSLINDKNTKMVTFIKSRVGNTKYYISKIISAFFVTFITVAVPFFLQFIVNHIVFPMEATKDLTNWETYSSGYYLYANSYLLSDLYYENIYIYFLVSLSLTGIFAGCLAVFLVGISSLGIKYKAFMFLPIYLLFTFVEASVGYVDFEIYLNEYITLFDIIKNKREVYYISLMLLVFLIGVVLIIIHARKKERID